MLTAGQLVTLKAAILADPVLTALPNGSDEAVTIANAFNALATPAYWGWRSDVSRADLYNSTSVDGTTWDWTIYKGQGVAEQNAWVQMFMGDQADFGKANLRAGIGKIFGVANANTLHCLAIGKRLVTRAEKLYAVDTPGSGAGRGTQADPDTLTVEGLIDPSDVTSARTLP